MVTITLSFTYAPIGSAFDDVAPCRPRAPASSSSMLADREAEHAEALAGGHRVARRVAGGVPHRRVRLHVRLGQDLARRQRPELALVALVGRPASTSSGTRAITSSQISRVPVRSFMLGEEAEDLVAPGAAAGAELEAAVGEVVEHRHPLGDLGRVVDLGERVEDARAEVDAARWSARGSRGTRRWPRGASTRRGSGAR